MLKHIILYLFSLVTAPADAWKRIAEDNESEPLFLKNFFYPYLGVAALILFVGEWLHIDDVSVKEAVQIALKTTITGIVGAFFGLFVSVFLLEEINRKFMHLSLEREKLRIFSGYCISFLLLLTAVVTLLPEFAFIRILQLYIIYIIWQSLPVYFDIPSDKRTLFTVVSTLILLITPTLIDKILILLMPGMR